VRDRIAPLMIAARGANMDRSTAGNFERGRRTFRGKTLEAAMQRAREVFKPFTISILERQT
jgi:hypothetical protein